MTSIAHLALSIRQPWAWLIVNGHKTVENRTWPTKVRGLVYIHAGKKLDKEGLEWIQYTFPHFELPSKYELGGIVGQARIMDCVTVKDNDPWFFGPYGFVLEDASPLPFSPCKGRLGFFDL